MQWQHESHHLPRPALHLLHLRRLALLAFALLIVAAGCTHDSVRTPARGSPTQRTEEGLPGGADAAQRIESGKAYEVHTWFNLAQRQYLEAIRLAPASPAGYQALLDHLERIQAYPAAWLLVARARTHGVALDPAVLKRLDEASRWPISTDDPADPPAPLRLETQERMHELAGLVFKTGMSREQILAQSKKADAAADRLVQLGYVCLPDLRRALAAERNDAYLRGALCNILLRVELGRRAVGEPADPELVREIATALLTIRDSELWYPLWNAATILARLGDEPGFPVLQRILSIDGDKLSDLLPAPRMEWDLLLVFAIGPLGEHGNDVIVPALRGADPIARANALRVLAVLFHEGLTGVVREIAKEDWAPEFRLMIALFHLQFRHDETYAELVRVIEHPSATEAHRMAAAQGLGELGTSDARKALQKLAGAGNGVVNRHAQQVLSDLQSGALAPPAVEGSSLNAEQTTEALAEMIGEYGVGTARLQGTFLRSCTKRDLPNLIALRGRILWRFTSEGINDLKAVNEIIRRVLREH